MAQCFPKIFPSLFLSALILVSVFAESSVSAQTVVDKTIATVSDGVKTDLITLSDLKWQLALQPNSQISPPNSEDLARALQTLINQRIFALEAERIPRDPPTKAEIDDAIADILRVFPSTSEFEQRLRKVGFESVKDANFQEMMSRRVAIKKYLDFRFRSFVVNTPDDIARHYREVFAPEFRRRYPGLLMPTLEEKRKELNDQLTEEKVATNIETFLDEAKRRIDVVILSDI